MFTLIISPLKWSFQWSLIWLCDIRLDTYIMLSHRSLDGFIYDITIYPIFHVYGYVCVYIYIMSVTCAYRYFHSYFVLFMLCSLWEPGPWIFFFLINSKPSAFPSLYIHSVYICKWMLRINTLIVKNRT